MRALRVLGIAENGAHLVCVGDERADGEPETFTLPLDDRLRAAVRGDLSRFGQLEIEMEPQLRPREIQSRIRAGASVEQVAAAAGCTPERIERYAYPVLMERTTVADRARRVHPLQGAAMGSIGAASSARTLQEIVTGTLADRGQHPDPSWDAFRDERGWTVTVTWRAGRSENRAEWAYHAGPDGGSITPRNQEAADLVDPAPRSLRTIGDDNPGGRRDASHPAPPERTTAERLVVDTVTDQRAGARTPTRQSHIPATTDVAQGERTGTDGNPATPLRTSGSAAGPTAGSTAGSASGPAAGVPEHHEDAAGAVRTGPHRSAQRGHRPPMPSWEDVLLGTRASGR